ncbi:WW domain-binding protein 2-like [Brevipalpus obovatus]|uniref:WW domain-binding protein 2-like n=1 Tax=Brevipalpus obovatus TaxID=246614 RepID=UPI003D9EF711
MGSINDAHQADGGVLLFSGELILLYCDSVQCEIESKGSTKGRIFLTTHRIVFTSSAGQNASVESFSAPFFAMSGLSLEQPIFGANSIKGKVSGQQEFTFELKFNKGGATEFAQTMRNAAKQAQSNSQQSGYQLPAYSSTPDPSSYYQTPVDNVYQPNYPVGFVLPTQQFSQAPPPGFIYACDVPPPYPGKIHRHHESIE